MSLFDMKNQYTQQEEQYTDNQDTREAIKKAWQEDDIMGLMLAGLDNFTKMICDRPIRFKTFLDSTERLLDDFILETAKQERLKYIGGKLCLELTSPSSMHMTADFYFQNSAREWVLKKKEGDVDSSRISDWNRAKEIEALRKAGKQEYSIDPPKTRKS